jgi:hypothetical protein
VCRGVSRKQIREIHGLQINNTIDIKYLEAIEGDRHAQPLREARCPVSSDGKGSVTHWITDLRTGDSRAAQPLWDRFFERLVGLVRSRPPLAGKAGIVEDEEDAALSAFRSVCMGLADGEHPEVVDRDDLWRFLVVIARRKAFNKARNALRPKQSGGRVTREA